VFQLWQIWSSFFKRFLVSGKRQWGACTGQQVSLPVTPANNLQNENTVITVAIVKFMATVIEGTLGGVTVEMMLDSGSSISLVQ